MTTTIPGNKISCRIASDFQAANGYNAKIGDLVMVGPTDYQISLADGTKPVIGRVIKPNVARGTGALAGTYPQPLANGDVTVDLYGHGIDQFTSGGALTPGTKVGIAANTQVLAAYTGANNTAPLGVVLNSATGSGQTVDVLVQGS